MISDEIEKGILHLLQNDPRLANVIRQSEKCSIKPNKQYYFALIRAIIGQQLSGIAADSIIRKFFNYYDGKPDEQQIINTADPDLRLLGLSTQKIKYIKDLSIRIKSGEIHLKTISKTSDEEIITELTRVKGIGVWTAHMFLIFTLSRLNVLPLNDLGIRKGIMKVYNLRKIPDEQKILALSKKYHWSPYCSIASWYLWKSLEL